MNKERDINCIRTSHLKKIRRSFYLQPTLKVAEQLIGKFLVRRLRNKFLVGMIVEVEAYLGSRDPASHAYKGKTRRNEVMFTQGGHLYVYFTYGMHFCCNVVTEPEGTAHAVLLRAIEPIQGLDIMARRRSVKLTSNSDSQKLCNGPAKLCEALGIRRNENGTDLCGNVIWIAEAEHICKTPIVRRSSRVGITNGREHRWRYFVKDSSFVSPGKPS